MTDPTYEKERNKLIRAATRHANAIHGKKPGASREKYNIEWTLTFFAEMNRLAKEKGLI